MITTGKIHILKLTVVRGELFTIGAFMPKFLGSKIDIPLMGYFGVRPTPERVIGLEEEFVTQVACDLSYHALVLTGMTNFVSNRCSVAYCIFVWAKYMW